MPITLGFLIPDVWSRHYDVPVANKEDELFQKLEEITGHAFNGMDWQVLETYNGHSARYMYSGDKYQCICSCDQLHKNFLVQHIPTSTVFTVGSECVYKFHNKELNRTISSLKRDNRCAMDKLIQDKRTKFGRKNQCEDISCPCKDDEVCVECHLCGYECACAYECCEKCGTRKFMCKCSKRCVFCYEFVEHCGCPKCSVCLKLLRIDNDDKGPTICMCELCHACLSHPMECVCKRKCPCGKSLEGAQSWIKLCIKCYYGSQVQCIDCPKLTNKGPRCYSCFQRYRLKNITWRTNNSILQGVRWPPRNTSPLDSNPLAFSSELRV